MLLKPIAYHFLEIFTEELPLPSLILDEEGYVVFMNTVASERFNFRYEGAFRKKGGEIMHCVNAGPNGQYCGNAVPCQDCSIRGAFRETMTNGRVVNVLVEVESHLGDQVQNIKLIASGTKYILEGVAYVLLMLQDITHSNNHSNKQIHKSMECFSTI